MVNNKIVRFFVTLLKLDIVSTKNETRMRNTQNTLVALLSLLGVKHTRSFSGRYLFFAQKNLLICFYFSVKVIIFVWLFPYGKVFALVYMQFDKRKPTAGYFKLHRLLYFTRAVEVSHPAAAITPEQVG